MRNSKITFFPSKTLGISKKCVILHSLKFCVTFSSEADVQRCSVKKGVLRNFTKFTGKHLCQSPFFNKVADLRPEILLEKRLWHRCFSVNFAKFLRTSFLIEHLRRLLLLVFHVEDCLVAYIKQISIYSW